MSLRVICRIPCKKEGTVRVAAAKHVNIIQELMDLPTERAVCTLPLRDCSIRLRLRTFEILLQLGQRDLQIGVLARESAVQLFEFGDSTFLRG